MDLQQPPKTATQRRILSALDQYQLLIHACEDSPWVNQLLRHLRSWTLDAKVTRLLRPPSDPPGTAADAIRFIDLDPLGDDGPTMIYHFCDEQPEAAVITVGVERDEQRYLDAIRAGAIDHITGSDGHELLRALLRTLAYHNEEEEEEVDTTERARSISGILRGLVDLPTLHEMDQLLLTEALRRNDGIVTRAAKLLGITPQAIHNRRRRANGC